MFFRTFLILASLASFASAFHETPLCTNQFQNVTFSDPSCFVGSGSSTQSCENLAVATAGGSDCGNIRIGITVQNQGGRYIVVQQLGIVGKNLVDIPDVTLDGCEPDESDRLTAEIDKTNACAGPGPQLAEGTYEIVVIINGITCRTGNQIAYGNEAPAATSPAPTPTGGPEGGSGEQSGGKRRRRLSAAANLVTPQDQVYQAHLDKCGEHEYNVSIYVDPAPHMYAILEPKSATTECPHGATHSIHYADGSYNKEILTFDTKADYQEMFEQEAFPIGTFTLGELEQAFQKIDVNSNHAYNVVENNCGMYLAKLGSELGVKVDHKMVSFVTRRLVEYSSKDLMDSIRKSAGALFQGRGLRAAVTDKDIVELLVQDSAADVLA